MEHKRRSEGWIDTFWKIEAYDPCQVEQPDGRYWFQNLNRVEDWVDLHFVLAGRMLYVDREGPQEVVADHALMFAHQEDSEYGVPPDFDEPLTTAWISFSGKGLREHWALMRRRFGSVFSVGADSLLQRAWQQLADHLRPDTPAAMALASTAVHAFVMQLYAFREQQENPRRSPVDEAVDELLRHPTFAWSLKEVAARHGCAREHLSRVFQRRVGCSPAAYLTRARLAKALDLIRCSTLPIQRIAEESGFGSTHTLARWVRSETGLSPRAVREQGLLTFQQKRRRR
jgi:AraC family transcriptional regulator of arabinose operon